VASFKDQGFSEAELTAIVSSLYNTSYEVHSRATHSTPSKEDVNTWKQGTTDKVFNINRKAELQTKNFREELKTEFDELRSQISQLSSQRTEERKVLKKELSASRQEETGKLVQELSSLRTLIDSTGEFVRTVGAAFTQRFIRGLAAFLFCSTCLVLMVTNTGFRRLFHRPTNIDENSNETGE